MSNVLLCALCIISVIGALFTTLVAIGVGSMCQRAQEDIRELRKDIEEARSEFDRINEFNQGVTECISSIGNVLDVINERTDWLDDIDGQIHDSFGQNKDGNKS